MAVAKSLDVVCGDGLALGQAGCDLQLIAAAPPLGGAQYGNQVIHLEYEPDMAAAPRGSLPLGHALQVCFADARTRPAVGLSSPPIKWSKVDLPEPLGLIRSTNSPDETDRFSPCQNGNLCPSFRVDLKNIVQLDMGGAQ